MRTEESTHATSSGQATTTSGVGRRRALAAVAAAGVCGLTALASPKIVQGVQNGAENLGHQVLAHELNALETISLDDAIRAAEITKAAVQVIVVPLAQLVAFIGGDALGILLASLNTATSILNSLHVNVAVLTALRNTVSTWHKNISTLPIALSSYASANIDNAEKYLKALKKSVQSS
jgi:hypothetical protein